MNLRILSIFLSAIVCGSALWPGAAEAHPLNNGYSQISIEHKQVAYDLFIPEASLLAFDVNQDKRLSPEELDAEKPKLAAYLQKHLQLSNRAEPMSFVYESAEKSDKESIPGVTFKLLFTAKEPVDSLTIDYSLLFDDSDPQHLNFALIMDGGDVDQTVFDASHRSYHYESYSQETMLSILWRYLVLGVGHIINIDAYDHLLFLILLLLVARGLGDIVKVVTAFTAAHSVTLFLTATGTIHVNPVWVEAGIALTIAYVAAENWFVQKTGHRWLLTFGFGLIHGMGFAGTLQEIGLPQQHVAVSLLSFNLGVELGQLAVVLVVLPFLQRLRKLDRYPLFVKGVSGLVFVFALYWFMQRLGIV
jgi:hypothetical protein